MDDAHTTNCSLRSRDNRRAVYRHMHLVPISNHVISSSILCTGHTQKNGAVSEVDKKLFLALHWHNIHCQQRELSKFPMRYQQFASHAYCGATGPVSKMAGIVAGEGFLYASF
jgi:hypothetical protein